MNLSTLYANEIARDRDRHLEHRRLLAESKLHLGPRPSRARRSVAIALAALSRGSAAAVRRLDACVADDLQQALAPTK